MDKFKGIGWVGGIYQKFETLCHEMDNIVNQDTVKYVENQAQSVGKSMKRFYSDVILPLKHEGQGVALRRSATTDASVESNADIQEDHINTVCKLLHDEPVAADPVKKHHASNELCLSVEHSIPTYVDALHGAESGAISQQVSVAMKITSCEVCIEGNAIRENAYGSNVPELISPSEEEESFGDSSASKATDCNDEVSSGIEGETRVNDDITVDVVEKQLECDFGERCLVDQPSNSNSVEPLSGKQHVISEQVADYFNATKPVVNLDEYATIEKPSAPRVSGLVSPFEKESCGASLASKFIDCNNKEMYFQADIPPATSVHDARKPSASDVSELIFPSEEEFLGASLVNEIASCDDKNPSVVHSDVSSATLVPGDQKAKEVKNDCEGYSECVSDASVLDASGGVTSSNMTSSAICCAEDMAEVEIDSSDGSVFKELYLPDKSLAKAFVCHEPINVVKLVSHNVHSSSMLTALLSNEEEFTAAVSISSGNDLSTESHGLVDDSADDINISSMETIELYDEVKLEDSCVIPDSTALYAVSRIMSTRKSYKKRIQDALTSRKRLSKEYEQLAIWFGDADMGSVHDHSQTLRPSSSTTTLEPKSTRTELVCDSDWELL